MVFILFVVWFSVLTSKPSGQPPSPLSSMESLVKPGSSGAGAGGKTTHSYAATVVKGGGDGPQASGTPPGKKAVPAHDSPPSSAALSSSLTPIFTPLNTDGTFHCASL